MMVKFGAITAYGLLSLAGEAMAQQTVKVMPFGASIVARCWRNDLEAKLKSAGITNFDFVGSQKGSPDCVAQFPGSDNDHEGHAGSQATDYAAHGNLTTWLNQQPVVDVVVMFLGHNDVVLGHKPQEQIFRAYSTLITQMRMKNPKMQIVWSNLTPLDPKRWDKDSPNNSKDIAALSAKIKEFAPAISTMDSPVRFVDNFSGYDPVADTEDGLHPNKSGNEKMASKFFSATRDAIQAASKGTAKTMRNSNIGTDFNNVVRDFLKEQRRAS
ncbi:SGNH hydrolase-type esterase domain-containing protein [Ampelomyces quisqualis]|uniref:SGNH hydrolase-type esterase domain-containing protein n=1 Tax=Ampelomyces quisqualis TaxID=50730 RepID=A0A6A5QXQ0_AMPQU|nr:SGNH hydrolase-type esterase domain-containing protein [Ampelomyces quisqualis]